MSNAPDQVRKRAMKRLMQDLDELKNEPVENVAATPLDDNIFEWHCNFLLDNTPYHLILFFPNNYPYESPSAEFVPTGFQFTQGAYENGRKGVKICLSIFSDFANYHEEWAGEKGTGWSPGYTVQTVLLNLVSFLAESRSSGCQYETSAWKNNASLAKGFSCKDCGHTVKKPFPYLAIEEPQNTGGLLSKVYQYFAPQATKSGGANAEKTTPGTSESSKDEPQPTKPSSDKYQIVDYISKAKFNPSKKPKDSHALYGYGLVVSGSKYRPCLTTPCEFITGESFYGMKQSMGKVHSLMKDELAVFLPLYLNESHGSAIRPEFETAMNTVKTILPNFQTATIKATILKTIPNLMNATVVEFSKGTQHTSDNHLNGYFTLHRLFLWAVHTCPSLQDDIDATLKDFIENERSRSKTACPDIGQWLTLLSASSKYTWRDAAKAYLSECWRRNVMWYVKDDAKLGYLDTNKEYRIEKTFEATAVSIKLLAFQVLFLDIAMPAGWTREQITARYDETMGFPTDQMVTDMKQAVAKINSIKTYEDWFKVLELEPPSTDELFSKLVSAVQYSINTDGYKMTSGRNQGGWVDVLRRYNMGRPQSGAPSSKRNTDYPQVKQRGKKWKQ